MNEKTRTMEKIASVFVYLFGLFFVSLGIFALGIAMEYNHKDQFVPEGFWYAITVFCWGIALLVLGFLFGLFSFEEKKPKKTEKADK